MYDWLTESLLESGTIVTANRRLARLLQQEYSLQQQASGALAWESPKILAWQDWLQAVADEVENSPDIPTRINAQQSQWLWETCWRKESDDLSGISNLLRLSRDAWQRLADWQVSIEEVARSAQGDEQHAFARVAGRYLAKLRREEWIDDAGLGQYVLQHLGANSSSLTGPHTFAGFDRQRPIVDALVNALTAAGVDTQFAPAVVIDSSPLLHTFENSTAEQRAAGAWARSIVDADSSAKVAIIASGLDSDVERISRRIREGATPGWQFGHRSLYSAVNVSYGKRLADYPAVATALLALRWLISDLNSADVSILMRSPLLGSGGLGTRHMQELMLRQWPDRVWSPSMLRSQLPSPQDGDSDDWSSLLASMSKRRREVPTKASPAEWAIFLDESLRQMHWPGDSSLDSEAFQLVNRWRELLNEFARLSLVAPKLTSATALAQLESMAAETVFQAESSNASIQLIGALEASGSAFDAIWITGLSSANWPPAGNRSMLISRRLQEKHQMPDSTPADTLDWSSQLLGRIMSSSPTVICSYALQDEETEQTVSSMLDIATQAEPGSVVDPDWHATSMLMPDAIHVVEDQVPSVAVGEKISGGAATLQRQVTEPISAFIQNRLDAKAIYPQTVGLSPPLRGSLLHDALYKLYIDCPDSDAIGDWLREGLSERVTEAVNYAFLRHEKNPDSTLRQLFTLERRRLAILLERFVSIDSSRDNFAIKSVEGEFEFQSGNIELSLRFDRLDACDDGSIAILDYKTGSRKQLVNRKGEVQDLQLFVYAFATAAPVSALALVNIDSREISFSGAGNGYSDVSAWPELMQQTREQIIAVCADLERGDVRMNLAQGNQAARALNLLTRYTEKVRDDE